jgi:hypothetical protein
VRQRADLYWLAGLAGLLTVVLADLLFSGDSLYFRDLARGFYPSARVFHDLVHAGDFPFWNPRYAGGQPFAANPAYMTFYPPNWLTLLPDFHRGFHLAILIHYYVAAFGMYLFLRSCSLQPPASGIGAIAWSAGGLLMSLSNLPPLLASAAWLPFFALFVRRFFSGRRVRDFAAAALVLGLILLIGEQSMILQAGALAGAYALYQARSRWSEAARALGLTALLTIAALSVAAVQIIPALDLQRDSGRAAPLKRGEAASWSLLPARPLELAFPNLFGRFAPDVSFYWAARFNRPFRDPFVLSFYPGLLMTAFIVAGFVRRVRGWQLAGAIAALSYLAAVFPLAYALGFKSIRYPEKFWISGLFALIVLGAIALDDVAKTARSARITLFIIAGVAASIGLFSLIGAYGAAFDALWQLGPGGEVALRQSKIAWPVTAGIAAACGVLLWLHGRLTPRIWILLGASILIADLAPRAGGLMPRLPRSYYEPPPLALELRRGEGPVRLFNEADWHWLFSSPRVPVLVKPWFIRNALSPRSYASWGFEGVLDLDVAGTDLLPTRQFQRALWTILGSDRRDRLPLLLKLSGATHSIDPLPIDRWRNRNELERMQPVTVARLPDPQRYYFADRIVVTPTADAFIRRLLESTEWSPRTAFVSSPVRGGASGLIMAAREEAGSIVLDVKAEGDALLVLAVTPHKYWRATIDRRPAESVAANVAFQAVPVPSGVHRIELAYRNDLLIACAIASAISAAVLLFFALRSRGPLPRWPR